MNENHPFRQPGGVIHTFPTHIHHADFILRQLLGVRFFFFILFLGLSYVRSPKHLELDRIAVGEGGERKRNTERKVECQIVVVAYSQKPRTAHLSVYRTAYAHKNSEELHVERIDVKVALELLQDTELRNLEIFIQHLMYYFCVDFAV